MSVKLPLCVGFNVCIPHTIASSKRYTISPNVFPTSSGLPFPINKSINPSYFKAIDKLLSESKLDDTKTTRICSKETILAFVFHFFLTKKGGGRREGSDRDHCLKRNSEPSKRKSSPATAAVSGFNALSTIIRSTISPVATGTIFCSLSKTSHDNNTSHNHLISKPIRV